MRFNNDRPLRTQSTENDVTGQAKMEKIRGPRVPGSKPHLTFSVYDHKGVTIKLACSVALKGGRGRHSGVVTKSL